MKLVKKSLFKITNNNNNVRDCTLEAIERYHQTHVFKVKYGFKKGGRFLEDLSDTDIKDLYSYTSTSLSLDKINKFTEARIN